MNIEYLKYFSELAKIQHYGKAAKALNISQPGLSHAIKSLEEEYGVPLFQKEGRNVSLSRYGKELMKDVRFWERIFVWKSGRQDFGRRRRQYGLAVCILWRRGRSHIC